MNREIVQHVDHMLALFKELLGTQHSSCASCGETLGKVILMTRCCCLTALIVPLRAAVFSECACVQLLASGSLHSTKCCMIHLDHVCSAVQHYLQISNCNAAIPSCCQLSRWLTHCKCMKLSLLVAFQCLLGAEVRSAGTHRSS